MKLPLSKMQALQSSWGRTELLVKAYILGLQCTQHNLFYYSMEEEETIRYLPPCQVH